MNLEYCLIENQYSKNKEIIVCITTEGETELDRSAVETAVYDDAVTVLNKYGFVALEKLWFERYVPEKLDQKKFKSDLDNIGLKESKELCGHLQDMIDLTYAVDKKSPIADSGDPNFFYPDETTDITDTVLFSDIVNSPKKQPAQRNNLIAYKLPEHEETISLCFYLFLDAKPRGEQNFYFSFRGDFFDDSGDEASNHVKPIKLDFQRLEWKEFKDKGIIVFQSKKTFKDIMEEMDYLYSVKYKFFSEKVMPNGKKMKGTMDVDRNILEIKDCIQPEANIVFETTIADFQNLCVISDHIEKEIEIESEEKISTSILTSTFEEIYERFDKKREDSAKEEDYEEASLYKNLIEDLDVRRKQVEAIDKKEITIKEYTDNFQIGKF